MATVADPSALDIEQLALARVRLKRAARLARNVGHGRITDEQERLVGHAIVSYLRDFGALGVAAEGRWLLRQEGPR